MKRRPDWREKLERTIREYENAPWIWGATDCAHFMGDCVKAVTDVDPIAKLRGRYDTRLSCMARIRAHGFRSVEAMAAAVFTELGCPEGLPPCSQVGDVGVTNDGILCVRIGTGFVARNELGQFSKVVPVRSWCIAWEGA